MPLKAPVTDTDSVELDQDAELDVEFDSDPEDRLLDPIFNNFDNDVLNPEPLLGDSDNSDKEDEFGGPDIMEPEPDYIELEALSTALASTTSLPLQPANPLPTTQLTTQVFEVATSTESLASTTPKGKRYNTVGARIMALAFFDHGFNKEVIFAKTGVTQSSCYKLRKKALLQDWKPGQVVEVQHVDDSPRSSRPVIATPEVIALVIKTVTKNSTTRSWSSLRIVQEVYGTPGLTPKEAPSAATVYRILRREGYVVCKRTAKPGLTQKQKAAFSLSRPVLIRPDPISSYLVLSNRI